MDDVKILNPCWCCGQECMFCPDDEKQDQCVFTFSVNGIHWCSKCKYGVGGPGHACDAP